MFNLWVGLFLLLQICIFNFNPAWNCDASNVSTAKALAVDVKLSPVEKDGLQLLQFNGVIHSGWPFCSPSGRGIRHLCRCVMLADFPKDCHWITLLLLWGGWCEKCQWTDGMGRARQMIPEVFFMPEHVFLSYLGVKQIPQELHTTLEGFWQRTCKYVLGCTTVSKELMFWRILDSDLWEAGVLLHPGHVALGIIAEDPLAEAG